VTSLAQKSAFALLLGRRARASGKSTHWNDHWQQFEPTVATCRELIFGCVVVVVCTFLWFDNPRVHTHAYTLRFLSSSSSSSSSLQRPPSQPHTLECVLPKVDAIRDTVRQSWSAQKPAADCTHRDTLSRLLTVRACALDKKHGSTQQ
jgi:hypothetical protein